MDLSIKVWQKENEYIANCPELDVFTYGECREQATSRLKKVIVFYAETASQLGYKIDPSELLGSLNSSAEFRTETCIN